MNKTHKHDPPRTGKQNIEMGQLRRQEQTASSAQTRQTGVDKTAVRRHPGRIKGGHGLYIIGRART